MLDQQVRRQYHRFLVTPIANRLGNRIRANQVTLLSALFGVLVLPALYVHQELLAIILLILSGYCDTLDGALARIHHHTSDWGSVMDIMADRLVEFTVVFALWSVDPSERGLGCILMLGSMLLCITSFLVVGIFTANQSEKNFHYSPGLMERAEAFIFFILMILWPAVFNALALSFTALVLYTAIRRLHQFYKQQ